MTIQPLPDDSPLSQTVLPSVWGGYKKSQNFSTLKLVDQLSETIQGARHLSAEEANKISNHFWTSSLHDFCILYLGEKLTNEDHARILKTANEFIKNGTPIRIDENETDLIKLLSAKVALNAYHRSHHTMLTACFLNARGELPKENIFMLQKGISPDFYEKEEFNRAEMLKNIVYDVPNTYLIKTFNDWFYRFGIRYAPTLNQMKTLSNYRGRIDGLILKQSTEHYETKERRINRHSCPRSRRTSWRGYGE